MLREVDGEEYDLVRHVLGDAVLHPRARSEAMRYVRVVGQEIVQHCTTIMQHYYRSTPTIEDFEHAVEVVWRLSLGITNDIMFEEFSEEGEHSEYSPSDDENSAESDDEDDCELIEFDEDDSGEEDITESSSDDVAQHLIACAEHTDFDQALAPPFIAFQDVAGIQRYLRNLSKKQVYFHFTVAAAFLKFVEHQLQESVRNNPCIFSRMGGFPLGLLDAFFALQSSSLQTSLHDDNSISVIATIRDLVDVLKDIQSRRGEVVLTTDSQPAYVAPDSTSPPTHDPRVISRLASELTLSSRKVVALQNELEEKRKRCAALEAKDKKVRELVSLLKNVIDLDEIGVSVMRELTRASSGRELQEPCHSLREGAASFHSAVAPTVSGERTTSYNERRSRQSRSMEGCEDRESRSLSDFVDRIVEDLRRSDDSIMLHPPPEDHPAPPPSVSHRRGVRSRGNELGNENMDSKRRRMDSAHGGPEQSPPIRSAYSPVLADITVNSANRLTPGSSSNARHMSRMRAPAAPC